MLCPQCKVEMKMNSRYEQDEKGLLFLYTEYLCRNPRCAEFGRVADTQIQRKEEPR